MIRPALRVAHILSAAAEAAHANGLTMLQVRIIAAVAVSGSTSPTTIAARLRVSLPTVSKPTDDMVKKKYLARTYDDDDRRKLIITTTPAGIELITKIDLAFRTANKLSPRKVA